MRPTLKHDRSFSSYRGSASRTSAPTRPASRPSRKNTSSGPGFRQQGSPANQGTRQAWRTSEPDSFAPASQNWRNSRWPVRSFVYGANPPAPSDFILSIQRDLAEALGIAVPQTGVLGAATRRAIKRFQTSLGIPPTGRLNRPTLRALKGGRRRASPAFDDSAPPDGIKVTAAPDRPPAPDVDSSVEAEPSDEPASAPPAADGDGPEESEFRIKTPGTVLLTRAQTLKLDNFPSLAAAATQLPDAPWIYVIKVNGSPWYVGHSASSMRTRFVNRWKALEDFKLKLHDLKGREITCYVIRVNQLFQVDYREGTGPYSPRPGMHGIVRAVEQHFIQSLKTSDKGNRAQNVITFANGVWIKLRFAGVGAEPLERSIDPNLNFAKSDR
jgi:peptidoglycan hydrolase-like protein with peptidoglycan-binding domain